MRFLQKISIATVLICLFCIPARAAGLTVTSSSGDVSGTTASYSATIANNGTAAANPVLILVWYESGILRDIAASSEAIAAGASRSLSANITVPTITDDTKITGFVWEDKQYSVPILLDEIERAGNGSTKLEGFTIAGIADSAIKIDDINKIIELEIPLYDHVGEPFDLTALETSAVVENAKSSVAVGAVELTGSDVAKTGDADYSTAKTVTVTSEDGQTAQYSLSLGRVLYESFETGVVSGFSAGEEGKSSLAGDFAVKGSAASAILPFSVTNVVDNYNHGNSVGVFNISNALLPASTTSIPVGSSGALGNALMIKKNLHSGESRDSSRIQLRINGTQMQGLSSATKLTIEYDVAYDFNVTGPNIGGTVAGLDITGSNYRIDTNVANTNIVTSATSGSLRVQNSGQATKVAASSTTNEWNHIKVELDKTTATAKFYVNGTLEQEAAYTISWPSGNPAFIFGPSSQRCVSLWLDNISISYR